MDVKPARAAVRPRVVSPATGEAVLLEDVIPARGTLVLTGGPGMGKSTALAHIAAIRPDGRVHDRSCAIDTGSVATEMVAMAPWGRDEILEYVMARHRGAVASVMRRVAEVPDLALCDGCPRLLVMLVDAMAADERLVDMRVALRRAVASRVSPRWRRLAGGAGLRVMSVGAPESAHELRRWLKLESPVELRHPIVWRILAVERIEHDLGRGRDVSYFSWRFDPVLIADVGTAIGMNVHALGRLRTIAGGDCWPTVAGVLHAANRGWTPDQDGVVNLSGAHLPKADWRRILLPGADVSGAMMDDALLEDALLSDLDAHSTKLRRADLHCAAIQDAHFGGASLDDADLSFARARGAHFGGASALRANFENADLTNATFTSASLQGARLARALLRGAHFAQASLDDADFSGADLSKAYLTGLDLRRVVLSGARLEDAIMEGCNLEGAQLPAAHLRGALLDHARLTSVYMPLANFERASLCGARLAHVHWERAQLQHANLAGATFHLGTSRSGMLFSGPSEGTRSGFYTDEYHEQSFKRPEEIRAANLRGADLRGANVANVDFYLVDLRDALYTPEQEAHFRKCRAILDVRTRGLE